MNTYKGWHMATKHNQGDLGTLGTDASSGPMGNTIRRPDPDPTALTTQQLLREVYTLRELLETRLDGMDKAVDAALAAAKEAVSEQNKNIASLMIKNETVDHKQSEQIAVLFERLTGAQTKLEDLIVSINERIGSQKEAVAIALEAADKGIGSALAAAERAAAKAELAADKQYLEAQIESLNKTFNAQIVTQKEAIGAALASADRAVSKAEGAAEKRFEDSTKLIAALNEAQKQFVGKSEVDFRIAALDEKINTALSLLDVSKGRGAGQLSTWGIVVTAITLLASIIGAVSILAFNN